jgi:high-affinity iron transporter
MKRGGSSVGMTVACLCGVFFWVSSPTDSLAAQVSGVVKMPDVCSPGLSPAVVYLTPAGPDGKPIRSGHINLDSAQPRSSSDAALDCEGRRQPATDNGQQTSETHVVLVNQRGLQFTPRVQAIALGQRVRFTNLDRETHNVHIVTPGFEFNQVAAPGQLLEFKPSKPGVMRLACDIHLHMRGFVVVGPTRWVRVCGADGRFQIDGVPDGRYVLTAWHEAGPSQDTPIEVKGGEPLDLPAIVLSAPAESRLAGQSKPGTSLQGPVRPWAEVLDRISQALAASSDAAARPGEFAKARRLAEDAYWVEFEASDLETAVRRYLGFSRCGELERQFREIWRSVREVAAQRQPPSYLDGLSEKLLRDLISVVQALNAKGITDRAKMDAPEVAQNGQSTGYPPANDAGATAAQADLSALLAALKEGFRRVESEADHDGPDAAASELTNVYMTEFEPLERRLFAYGPQDIRNLEIRFNTLRGEISGGIKGQELAARVDSLTADVQVLLDRVAARPTGTFGAAFVASLVTIAREGLEVILILAMLIALVSKTFTPATAQSAAGAGQVRSSNPHTSGNSVAEDASLAQAKRRALGAIWWGTGLAVIASIATAIALGALVASAQGGAREILEGAVMLVAACVLFYVSHWLISHVESKRWVDFLKHQARRGLELGGKSALALTAFLAVYREGAETALLYQALLGSEGKSQAGFAGVVVGLLAGLALLIVIAAIIRVTTVRLPMRTFFQLSGLFLLALSVVFAGNGVFELQNAGVLHITSLHWMGQGLPSFGVYPNVQVLSVQLLLLGGAVLAWLLLPREAGSQRAAVASDAQSARRDQQESGTVAASSPGASAIMPTAAVPSRTAGVGI